MLLQQPENKIKKKDVVTLKEDEECHKHTRQHDVWVFQVPDESEAEFKGYLVVWRYQDKNKVDHYMVHGTEEITFCMDCVDKIDLGFKSDSRKLHFSWSN